MKSVLFYQGRVEADSSDAAYALVAEMYPDALRVTLRADLPGVIAFFVICPA